MPRLNRAGLPTCERLRQLFDYDPDTGLLTWRVAHSPRVAAGSVAGSLSTHRYWRVQVDGRALYMHRVIWCWVFGEWPQQSIDHINETKTDNRLCNLRDVSDSANKLNVSHARSDSRTGTQGVTRERDGAYRAYIQLKGRRVHLGRSRDLAACAQMYAEAKTKLNLNEWSDA